MVLGEVDFGVHCVDVVDGARWVGWFGRTWFFFWVHWGEIQSCGSVSGSDHVDSVGFADGFDFVLVKDNAVTGITQLADGEERAVGEAWVGVRLSGVAW